ncbi:MAG: hypothetical protein RRB22_13320 [Gammaproteobacteria bacterium]|nr:hypothetical protein [Gammaproteobacteria bacterium]
MKKEPRLLDPSMIPSVLWCQSSDLLELPNDLSKAYVDIVDAYDLRDLGTQRDSNRGPVGGLTKESAEQHFAQAFDGSAARALLAVLDPKHEAGTTSNTFIRCTAGNTISLTDAPCGAGAAAFSFLCALAELRKQKVLPRLPLDVHFIGAELSDHSRNLAKEMLERLTPALTEQAIFVTSQFISWNVLDPMSTTDLVSRCVRTSSDSSSKLLVVANFNGFLEKDNKRESAKKQLDELFRYASGEQSFAVWIEPAMNEATTSGGLLPWLHKQFTTVWKRFGNYKFDQDGQDLIYVSTARFKLPLLPSETSRVTLAVMPIELKRSS